MKLELVTLSGTKLDQEVYSVSLPTSDGEIGVFPGHEPLISIAVPGVIGVKHTKSDKDEELFAISGGVIEISQARVRVLVDSADSSDEIVETEVKAALERAKKLASEAKDKLELDKALEMIDRHSVRLKVAELRRHKRH